MNRCDDGRADERSHYLSLRAPERLRQHCDAVAYWLSQIGAGLIAALLVRTVIDPTQTAATATLTLGAQPCWRRSSRAPPQD
jgi:hypothetical protein